MIITAGCSFTAGDTNWPEGFSKYGYLPYNNENSSQPYDIHNIAASGSGNTIIRRKLFWYLNNSYWNDKFNPLRKVDYAIIQWSTIDRWDYPIFVDDEKAKNFPRMDMHPERINKINYMHNGTDTFGYGNAFYEKYYSIYGAVIETLENIYHAQLYLKEKNIPYKMITIGNLFGMDVAIDKLINLQKRIDKKNGDYSTLKIPNILEKIETLENSWHDIHIIYDLLDKIDFNKFIFTDDVRIGGFGGGIIEWFLNKNEILAGGQFHPSKEQSIDFFDNFLMPNIKNELEKNYIKIKDKIV
jgi:hypothetical protein